MNFCHRLIDYVDSSLQPNSTSSCFKTASVFVYFRRHHVWEQPGPPHRAMGPHCSHTLHQQPAGDGRLQHHHHWLPRRPDLPVGHDARAGGERRAAAAAWLCCRSLTFFNASVKFFFWSRFVRKRNLIFCPGFRFVPGPCCLVTQPPSPVCQKPVHAVTNSTLSVRPRVGEYFSFTGN